LSQPLFLSTLTDIKTLTQIGNAYRKQTPAETNETTLTDLLTGTSQLDNSTPQPENSTPQPDNSTLRLDNTVKEDFASGHTLTINGWVLSITEARQCALLSVQKQ
jgi:hypothetical protein